MRLSIISPEDLSMEQKPFHDDTFQFLIARRCALGCAPLALVTDG